MIQPAFSEGLPPDGAEGLHLACDSDGLLWLLRWASERNAFAALGWPGAGNPEQRFVTAEHPGWSIAGHQPIEWVPPAPPDDAAWVEVPPEDPAALPAPEA